MRVCSLYSSRQLLCPGRLYCRLTPWFPCGWLICLCSLVSLAMGGCLSAGPPVSPAPRQQPAPPHSTARAAEQQAAFAKEIQAMVEEQARARNELSDALDDRRKR